MQPTGHGMTSIMTFHTVPHLMPSGRNCATGVPLEINQANILLPLAPKLSARTDTFRIRAYGEVRDADDNIIASAICEAVVQRCPSMWILRRILITTNHGMMTPKLRHSIRSTRPTADVLRYGASDGWMLARCKDIAGGSFKFTKSGGKVQHNAHGSISFVEISNTPLRPYEPIMRWALMRSGAAG